jgi:hypothetical protein
MRKSKNTAKSTQHEKQNALFDLIQYDVWGEDLLSDMLFGKSVETVLAPRERFILEAKVQGYSDKYIMSILRHRSPQQSLSEESYEAYKDRIKRKLRDGYNPEIAGWIRAQNWDRHEDAEHD